MSLFNTSWYVNWGDGSTTGYYAVAKWAATTAYTVGQTVRQNATPAVGGERVFICTTAGTSAGTEPAWNTGSRTITTTDGTVKWNECTGQPAVNGDASNTPSWQSGQSTQVGIIIKNTAADHFFICTTSSGNTGATEPTWNTTTGVTTTDGSNVWTCLGTTSVFSAWSNPIATFETFMVASPCRWNSTGSNGDTYFVSDLHQESQASGPVLRSPSATLSSAIQLLCIDHTASLPPTSVNVTTGAKYSTTGANNITFERGMGYLNGIEFSAGSSSNTASIFISGSSGNATSWYFENFKLTLANTSASSVIQFGSNGNAGLYYTILANTQMKFGSTSQGVNADGDINPIWRNTPNAIDTGGSIPTTLFNSNAQGICQVNISGVDLSAMGSGTTIVGAQNYNAVFNLDHCKLGASVTVAATPTRLSSRINVALCDSGANAYRNEVYASQGTMTTETTVVRSGGASDGTTPVSWKHVTTTNAGPFFPMTSIPFVIWNATTGVSQTATVEILNDGTTLTNSDIWLSLEYMSSTTSPLATWGSSGLVNPLSTPTNVASSTATWTTTGISSPVKQKIQLTFTAEFPGYVCAVINIAKQSSTIYVDPLITIT